MISLPDFSKSFDYENGFYLSCASSRIGKSLAHYELFKMALRVPGVIVECGVFKGASLSRFAMFRDLLCSPRDKRRMVAFDTFGKFPETNFRNDKKLRKHFVDIAGEQSISVSQMRRILKRRGLSDKVDLVAGDIVKTLPAYIKKNRHLKIAVLNLDTDIYEPAVAILEHLYPRICKGGILILDDYGVFPGETKAVDDYFRGCRVKIRRFPFAKTPCYIIKE